MELIRVKNNLKIWFTNDKSRNFNNVHSAMITEGVLAIKCEQGMMYMNFANVSLVEEY